MGPNTLAVNATFLLSGMLGLQIALPEGFNSSDGKSVEASIPFSIAPEVSVEYLQNNTERTGKSMIANTDQNNCGSSTCKNNEKCVSWQNQNDTRGANIANECMLDDGRYSTKANPNSMKLCGPGETHSLIITEPRLCLSDNPPCDIVWKYKCVTEEDSPHSCEMKKCPEDFLCFEILHCERYPPCIFHTECHHISEADVSKG
ncbi:uncharacterized protein LOC110845041 [Folsomia candida]|uniref:Uncharacterized protein n=1 Tax=Folsomia candida TaxID=158441 RepID=A0A226EPS4_FOLCA|nr:uncharacterized protein LOC110845041 [Folsomia candida]OXA59489.1 hypothetical protein Fcan01_04435 [Folsomia candida]